MAEASKLELLLLAKDKMSPAVQRLLKLFKQAEKDGKSGAKAIDELTKKLERAPKSDGLKKHNAETKKTTTETEKAAKAQEKLNNARKKKTADGSTAKEAADKIKLAGATEKAAKAEEKLNNARKRSPKTSSDNPRRRTSPDGQRTRTRNQNNVEEDLIQGGTGAGMLWTSKKGITSAMSKQEALTDLSSAFYRSSLSAAELNSQMREGEKIADELGNKLPGNTADFLNMFVTMKQRGIETNSILKGAGKSAAYLSVANKEDRQDVGKNIARFGQMFDLKTEKEYMQTADLMSRANTTYGINSSELMEAVKDFSGRTGKGLGLEGGKGAEDTLRYLSFLRAKTGLEGLTVGTAASSFFNQYLQAKQKKKDPTEELKKLTGVDLKIFDEKGKFKGLENAVKEFSKLKGKLSDEQQVAFGNALAGEEGASVFQAMVKNGEQWDSFNQEMTQSISLQDKSAKNAQNLTNKLEALTGSLENLGSAAFGPLLEPLGKVTDGTNSFVGKMTDVAKANPVTAATTASLLTLAGAYLAFKGGSGVISSVLNRSRGDIDSVGRSAEGATKKVGGLKRGLSGLKSAASITLSVAGIIGLEYAIEQAVNSYYAAKESQKGANDATKQNYSTFQKVEKEGTKFTQKDFDSQASTVWGSVMNLGLRDTLRSEVSKKPMFGYSQPNKLGQALMETIGHPWNLNKFQGGFFSARQGNTEAYTKGFKETAPQLADARIMTAFLQQLDKRVPVKDEQKPVKEALSLAFPESFKQASLELASSQTKLSEQNNLLGQTLANLQTPTAGLVAPMSSLTTNSNNAANASRNFANSANSAASRMSSMQITPPVFSPIKIPVYTPVAPNISPDNLLGRAKGGSVKKGSTYRINEIGQEFFTPNQSGSIVSNDILRNARNSVAAAVPNVNLTVHINVDGSQNPKQVALEIKRELASIVREMKDEMTPRRIARKVAYEAERDSELT